MCLYVLTYLALPVLISHEANVRSTRPIHLGSRGGKKMARMKGRPNVCADIVKILRGPFLNPGRPFKPVNENKRVSFFAPTLFPDVSKITEGFYRGKVKIGEWEVLVITLTRYRYINFPPGNRIFWRIRDKMKREWRDFRFEEIVFMGGKKKVFQRSLNPCFASDTKFLLAKCKMNTFLSSGVRKRKKLLGGKGRVCNRVAWNEIVN